MTGAGGPSIPWHRRDHNRLAVAMILAVVVGLALRATDLHDAPSLLHTIDVVATLFLRLLKMVIVPLVLASIVVGVSSLDVARLGSLGVRTVAYYVSTTGLAVGLGLVAVNVIRPGEGARLEAAAPPSLKPDGITKILLDIVPENPFAAAAAQFDLMSVIFFAIVLAIGIAAVGERARPLRDVFDAVNEVMMWVTGRVMRLAPVGIFALVLDVVLESGTSVFGELAMYFGTVAGSLALHGAVVLPLILWVTTRLNPLHALRAFSPALLTAMSTASSSATLPLTIEAARERAGVRGDVAGFVLPLGSTVNMDGTALYEAVAAIFIAQAFGIELSATAQVVVFLTATLAAIGAAGVPSAGLVTMVIVLEAVGLPVEGIGLLLAVDRPLDMLRTTVNVWGDALGSVLLARREGALDESVYSGVRAE